MAGICWNCKALAAAVNSDEQNSPNPHVEIHCFRGRQYTEDKTECDRFEPKVKDIKVTVI